MPSSGIRTLPDRLSETANCHGMLPSQPHTWRRKTNSKKFHCRTILHGVCRRPKVPVDCCPQSSCIRSRIRLCSPRMTTSFRRSPRQHLEGRFDPVATFQLFTLLHDGPLASQVLLRTAYQSMHVPADASHSLAQQSLARARLVFSVQVV